MLASGDNIKLLLAREVDELYRIAGHTDRKVGVLGLFGVFHAISELVHAKYINVEVVRPLVKVAVENVPEVVHTLRFAVTQRAGADGLGVGNAVERKLIGQLGNGVERGEQTVFLGAVGRVRAGRKGCACLSAVGRRAGR